MNSYTSPASIYNRTPTDTTPTAGHGRMAAGPPSGPPVGRGEGIGSIGAYSAWPTPTSMYSDHSGNNNNGWNQQSYDNEYGEAPKAQKAHVQTASMIKVQKKGERESHLLNVHSIKSWDDLIHSIGAFYKFPTASPPRISTYEGDFVTSANYLRFLKNKQHLILSFPIDHNERKQLLQSLSSLSISTHPSLPPQPLKTLHSSPRSPESASSAYSPRQLDLAAMRQREKKLSEGHEDIKALAERVRNMAEQTLSMFQAESSGPGQHLTPSKPRMTNIRHSPATSLSSSQLAASVHGLQTPISTPSHPKSTAGDSSDEEAELNWTFHRDPSVFYPAADQWATTKGRMEQEMMGIPPIEDDYGLFLEKKHAYRENKLERMLSPDSGTIPTPRPSSSTTTTTTTTHDGEGEAIFTQQSDHVETQEAHHILLCPHLTFHSLKPMDIKVNISPTITVIPPSEPQDHERYFATAVGEKIDLNLSLKHNGKITEVISRPEGEDQPEPITLLRKSQGKGAGGRWHISRMESQIEGAWGKAQVGELGGDGNDGKKRNGGEFINFGFKGEENFRRSFALAFDKVTEFLDLFMDTCGFPKRERDTMTSFWAKRLPREASDEFFLLVKIQPVKTMISLLPIVVEPAPDRAVRFFLTMKIMSRDSIKEEELDIAGVMSSVVQEVLGAKPRPVVPASLKGRGKGKTKTIGKETKAASSRAPASTAKMQEQLSDMVDGPKSGLTIFEYGGILIATKDMLRCSMPKEPQEDCGNPLPVEIPPQQNIPSSHEGEQEEGEEYEDSDDMELDYDSDPSSLGFSTSTPLSNSTAGTSPAQTYNTRMAEWSFHDAAQVQQPVHIQSPPQMPSTYWTGPSFPIQEEQKYDFGDYIPMQYPQYVQPYVQQTQTQQPLLNSHMFTGHLNHDGPFLSQWGEPQRYM